MPGSDRSLVAITPAGAGWSHVGFQVYRVSRGARIRKRTGTRELCAVVLLGRFDITFAEHEWRGVGSREGLFEGPPDAVYVPPGGVISMTAISERAEVALCWAQARKGATPSLIRGDGIEPLTRGGGRTERTIHPILMEDREAESLLVSETLTPGGNWSSYPPHKHDTDNPPAESLLEETYYHRLARPEGFAVQLVYSGDRSLDEAFQVHDGDVVLVPRGFHAVAASPGCDLYYLNVMAGPRRRWLVTTDPDHRWQLEQVGFDHEPAHPGRAVRPHHA